MTQSAQRVITRDDENKFLQEKIRGNVVFNKPVSCDEIMASVIEGKIKLEMTTVNN